MFGSGTRNNKRCYLRQKLPPVYEAFTPGPITLPLFPQILNIEECQTILCYKS